MAIDFLRGPRWYASLAVAGAILFGLWLLLGGGPGYVIQIDYQWTGDLVEGAEVVIDGVVVGKLERVGNRPVIGFEVEPGRHVVDLNTDGCLVRPETVVVGPPRLAQLMADMEDRAGAGRWGCLVFFR
ncbi:MAG: hypothetical protein AMXMBFR53_31270 [Gemmatimonadota bacterium]